MKRRLFIGIVLPQDIGKRVDQKLTPLSAFPIIWTAKENRHIPLLFLGWVDDEHLAEMVSDITEAIEKIPAFDVIVDRITVTPRENPDRLELVGEENEELKNLYNVIAQSLDEFASDRKTFVPRVTLGRVRRSQWRNLSEEPTIDIPVRFSLPVSEVSLFESTTIEGKRKYVVIEAMTLS